MNAPTLGREQLIAGVLAATDKLVGQVGNGDWQSANKTVADRRLLLEQLAQQPPTPGEHDFLRALREAAAESEVALRSMSQVHSNSASSGASSSDSVSFSRAGGRLDVKA